MNSIINVYARITDVLSQIINSHRVHPVVKTNIPLSIKLPNFGLASFSPKCKGTLG